jgi:hypothetical protein
MTTPLSLDELERTLRDAREATKASGSPLTVSLLLLSMGTRPSLFEAQALIASLEALPALLAIARAARGVSRGHTDECGNLEGLCLCNYEAQAVALRAALAAVTP